MNDVVPLTKSNLDSYIDRLGDCLFKEKYEAFGKDYPFHSEVPMTFVRPSMIDNLEYLFIPFLNGIGLWCFKSQSDKDKFIDKLDGIGGRT